MPFPANLLAQGPADSVVPERLLLAKLSDDGTPTGTTNAIGNYGSPTDFWITAPPGLTTW